MKRRKLNSQEAEQIREIERVVLLKVIDNKWMTHIDDMDQLRQGIGLQAYGQRDPLVEYKMSAYEMFDGMTAAVTEETVRILFHVRVEQKVEREPAAKVTGTNRDDALRQSTEGTTGAEDLSERSVSVRKRQESSNSATAAI